MAKPITWRTIAGPSFNNSAGGQAIQAFNLAGTGFLQGAEQLAETQKSIDQGYTRDAMREALRTGQVDPNLNPRADSAAIYEALLGKRKADTDNTYTQAQTRNIGLEADERAFQQSPGQRAIEARRTAQELAAGEIGMRADLAGINADTIAARLNQRRYEIENRNDANAQQIKSQYRALENFLVQGRQRAYDEYLQNNPGDMAGANQAAIEWDQYNSRAEVEEFRVKNNIMPEAYELSTWGGRDALRDASEAALAEKRRERSEARQEAEDIREISERQGYLGNTVLRNGVRTAYTDDMAEVERMTSYKEAVGKLRLQGIDVDMLDGKTSKDTEHQVIEAARQVLPNASLLAPAIEPFIKNGKFDAKGFRKNVLNKVGPLTIQDRINLSRTEAGLPPVDMGMSTSDGSDKTARDILGDTSSLAERGGLLSPANLQKLLNTEPFGAKQGRQFGEYLRKQLIGNEAGQPILDLDPYVNPFPVDKK